MSLFEMDKISLKEALNNDNGKTSSKKLIGVTTSLLCLLIMIMLTIYYFCNPSEGHIIMQLYDKIIVIFGIACGLMGVKSVSNAIVAKHAPTTQYISVENNTTNNECESTNKDKEENKNSISKHAIDIEYNEP